jgi:hypothetical protein
MQANIPKPILKNETIISSVDTGDPPPRKLLDRDYSTSQEGSDTIQAA